MDYIFEKSGNKMIGKNYPLTKWGAKQCFFFNVTMDMRKIYKLRLNLFSLSKKAFYFGIFKPLTLSPTPPWRGLFVCSLFIIMQLCMFYLPLPLNKAETIVWVRPPFKRAKICLINMKKNMNSINIWKILKSTYTIYTHT